MSRLRKTIIELASDLPNIDVIITNKTSNGFENYTKQKKLGSGVYGAVYSVTQEPDSVLKYGENLRMVISESVFMANMNHPNIIKLKKIIIPSHSPTTLVPSMIPVLVIERVDGDMHKFINKGYNTVDNIKKFFKDILSAIYYLHINGIYHRDIHLGNILYKKLDDGTFQFYLGDLGLASFNAMDNMTSYERSFQEDIESFMLKVYDIFDTHEDYNKVLQELRDGDINLFQALQTVEKLYGGFLLDADSYINRTNSAVYMDAMLKNYDIVIPFMEIPESVIEIAEKYITNDKIRRDDKLYGIPVQQNLMFFQILVTSYKRMIPAGLNLDDLVIASRMLTYMCFFHIDSMDTIIINEYMKYVYDTRIISLILDILVSLNWKPYILPYTLYMDCWFMKYMYKDNGVINKYTSKLNIPQPTQHLYIYQRMYKKYADSMNNYIKNLYDEMCIYFQKEFIKQNNEQAKRQTTLNEFSREIVENFLRIHDLV